MPVRQPKRRVVELRGARSGMLRDMEELISIKREEEGVLHGEIVRRNETLAEAFFVGLQNS